MNLRDTGHLPSGSTVGPYRLQGLIGQGGMGAVYRAEQLSLQREVALKVLHSKRVQDQQAVDGFLREARIAASLSHHHLVPIYDVGYDPEHRLHFYVMKLIRGRTLSTLVHQEGALEEDAALTILEQVASAMGHAHSQGVVHRDLKPGNIIIDEHAQAVVTDLGLALDRLSGHRQASKRVLKLVGTAEYAAPEQLRNPDRATAASDVWGLGATLYFLLTGEEPFSGETLLDLVVRVATEVPAQWQGLSSRAQQLLGQLMNKDAQQRPPDGYATLALLQALRNARTAKVVAPARRRPASRTRTLRRR